MQTRDKRLLFKVLFCNVIFIIYAIWIIRNPEGFAIKPILVLAYAGAMLSNLFYVLDNNIERIMDFLRLEDDDDDWIEF